MVDDEEEETPTRRRRLEGVIPELIKRAVELGVEKAHDAPENIRGFVADLKLPKEMAGYIFGQVEETKNELYRVVAREMRDFLEQTNFAGEMQKLLTTVQFEINTTIRFSPNDQSAKPEGEGEGEEAQAKGKPEVKLDVFASRRDDKGKEKKERRKAPKEEG